MDTLLFERDGHGVATLTFNRPEKKNAINNTMWRELLAVLDDVEEDAETRVLVLTGAGDAARHSSASCSGGTQRGFLV